METKITVIIDNIPQDDLKGEWGLSLLVEYEGKQYLADAGASDLFSENLEKLGFDIKNIDHATLSHAHYDHGNGMPKFFEENQKAKFYVRKTTEENCYYKFSLARRYIGLPKNVMEKYADRIKIVGGDYKLEEGVYLIPHKTAGLDKIGKREKMYRKVKTGWKADDFSHEQSLVFDTDKGLVVINCCCHGGAVNIIHEVAETFPQKHVFALIGGFHLFNKSEEEVKEVAKAIKDTGIEYICTGHCTGKKAYDLMKEELGDSLHQLQTGLKMTF